MSCRRPPAFPDLVPWLAGEVRRLAVEIASVRQAAEALVAPDTGTDDFHSCGEDGPAGRVALRENVASFLEEAIGFAELFDSMETSCRPKPGAYEAVD
mmetsp:Transcript_69328/g.193010  ORF Transcript_69328/g.193010 Transcript_69328/m.193010 type:complete len:98 (-) Transcript_69328:209-502(-)